MGTGDSENSSHGGVDHQGGCPVRRQESTAVSPKPVSCGPPAPPTFRPRPPSGPIPHLGSSSLPVEVRAGLGPVSGPFFFFFKHIGLVLDLEGYTRTYSAWRFPECVKSQSKFQKLKIVNNGCGGVCAAVSC